MAVLPCRPAEDGGPHPMRPVCLSGEAGGGCDPSEKRFEFVECVVVIVFVGPLPLKDWTEPMEEVIRYGCVPIAASIEKPLDRFVIYRSVLAKCEHTACGWNGTRQRGARESDGGYT